MVNRPDGKSVTCAAFGHLPDGRAVEIITLTNARGMTARILTFGAILQSLTAPDRDGNYADIVLGNDSADAYFNDPYYIGATVGRYANRIRGGQFPLDGVQYQLSKNDGANHLHGGVSGFGKKLWAVRSVGQHVGGVEVILQYVSDDGEEGYPGTLTVEAHYILRDDNRLVIRYVATTTLPTIVNVTHHAYFNLAGHGDILGHRLQIAADQFAPIDAQILPIGSSRDVSQTPFDFRTPKLIGQDIEGADEQLKLGNGYDHHFFGNVEDTQTRVIATVEEPKSGRRMELATDAPGVQFYSGNYLEGHSVASGAIPIERRSAFCLEPQYPPDSPNISDGPSPVLGPGAAWTREIILGFSLC